MKRKVITPPQCQWMPVPNGYGVRLYSSASDVADTVRGAQQEIDRLHRRLWEKRHSAVWVQLMAMQNYFSKRGMVDRCKRAQMRMRKLELMEYKP